MSHALALVQLGLRIGRWLLPLVAVLFVSATIAYAINGTVARGSPAGDQRPDLGVSSIPERCAPIGSSFMDSSIVAEVRKIECGWAH